MSRSLSLPVALLSLLIGAASGGVLGYTGHALFAQPEVVVPPPEIIREGISEDDLAALCEELTDGAEVRVMEAQTRVSALQQQLSSKEQELSVLKQEAEQNSANREVARRRWREMEAEVASLRVQLTQAESERDELRTELKQTLRDLDRQIVQTQRFQAEAQHFKQESTKNLWSAFGSNAKVEMCDRGTRRRHENCHETVEAAIAPYRDLFSTCVDSQQAVPVLKQGDRKEDTLPEFAEWLPDDNKFTKKGWYVIFCDPTLPEATDEEAAMVRPQDNEQDLPDFDDDF
ncbi:MAG: hypothetical protein ACI8S6_001066 [Myxococcota bacterium]|jgi:hypothetical protein